VRTIQTDREVQLSREDDTLLGFRKPADQEIVRQAREAAARMLVLLEARQF